MNTNNTCGEKLLSPGDSIELGKDFHIRRGDVLFVDLRGAEGGEKYGKRPAIVVQNDIGNEHGGTTIVAPVTSQYDPTNLYPFEVELDAETTGLEKDSIVQLNQLRTLSIEERVEQVFNWVNDETLERIDDGLKYVLSIE
jgi:mRNA interferase MazF